MPIAMGWPTCRHDMVNWIVLSANGTIVPSPLVQLYELKGKKNSALVLS
jgi:hypothetical protein